MTLTLLTQPDALIHMLGWSLVHSLWQGAVIAMLLALIFRAFPRESSNARYVLGCVALIGVVGLAGITGIYYTGAQPSFAPIGLTTVSIGDQSNPTFGLSPATTAALPATRQSMTDQTSLADRCLPWVVLAWLAGLTVVSCRLFTGWLSLWWACRRGTVPVSADLQARVSALCDAIGVSQSVRALESASAVAPMVVGWIRPIILLPTASITGLSSQQLQAVIAHELAHVLRHDYAVNLLQCVAETLFFYHPAVWWIGRMIRQERERCCDDLAVRVSGDRLDYARALLLIAESAPPYRARLSVASQGGDLSGRVRRLLGIPSPPPHSRWAAGLWTAVASLCVVIVLVGGAWAQETAPNDPARLIDDLLAGEAPKGPKIEVPPPYIIEIPYDKLIDGDPAYNVVIRPNDVIKIVGAGPYGYVYLQGEVNRPGAYRLPGYNDLTLKQLIASAGGWRADGPPMYAKRVRRLGPDAEETLYYSLDDLFEGWTQDAFLAPNDLVQLSTEPGPEDEQAKERRLLRERLPSLKAELASLREQMEAATHDFGEGHRLTQSINGQIKTAEDEVAEIKKILRRDEKSVMMKIIPAPKQRGVGQPPRPEDLIVIPLPNTAQPKERVNITANKYGENYEQTTFVRELDKNGVLNLPGIAAVAFLGRHIEKLEAEVLAKMKSHMAYSQTEQVTITLPDRWLFVPVYPPKSSGGGPSIMFHIPQADFRVKDALRMMRTYGDIPTDTRVIRVIRQGPIVLTPTQP